MTPLSLVLYIVFRGAGQTCLVENLTLFPPSPSYLPLSQSRSPARSPRRRPVRAVTCSPGPDRPQRNETPEAESLCGPFVLLPPTLSRSWKNMAVLTHVSPLVLTPRPFPYLAVVCKAVQAKSFAAKKVALSAAVTTLAAQALPALAVVSHAEPLSRAPAQKVAGCGYACTILRDSLISLLCTHAQEREGSRSVPSEHAQRRVWPQRTA